MYYRPLFRFYIQKSSNITDNNIKWQNIVDTCSTTAEEILEKTPKNHKSENSEIQKRSSERHNLRMKIIAHPKTVKNKKNLKLWKKQRMTLLKEIRQLKKEDAEKEAKKDHEQLDKYKDDSNKYYQVIRELNRKTPRKRITVSDKNGNTPGTTEGKIKIIKQHCEKALAPKEMETNIKEYDPSPLQ